MAEKKNFTIENYNGTDYDTLYPETNSGQVLLDTTAQAATNLPSGKTLDDALHTITKDGGGFQVGDTLTTARTNLGDKWLLCNGQNVLVNEYPNLATVLPHSFYEEKKSSTAVASIANNIPYASFQLSHLDGDKFIAPGMAVNGDNHGAIYNSNLSISLYGSIDEHNAGNTLKDIQYQEASGKYICCIGGQHSSFVDVKKLVYVRDSLNATTQTALPITFTDYGLRVVPVPNSTSFYVIANQSSTNKAISFYKVDSITSSSYSTQNVAVANSVHFVSHGLYLNGNVIVIGGHYSSSVSNVTNEGYVACNGSLPSLKLTYPRNKYYGVLSGNDNVVVTAGGIDNRFAIMASTDFSNWVNTGFPVTSNDKYPCTLVVIDDMIIVTIANGDGVDIYKTGYASGYNWQLIQHISGVAFTTGTISKDKSTVYWLGTDGLMRAYSLSALNIPSISISNQVYTYMKAKP